MTQEDKELLFKFLCAILPYGVIIEGLEHPEIMTIKHLALISAMSTEPYKPYLRPMSSMTEEEDEKRIQLGIWRSAQTDEWEVVGITSDYRSSQGFQNALKFLLENHFDIFGLIPKGLAIEVTEENNPYKQ